MKENKMSVAVSVVIFTAVIVFLVFITINKKESATSDFADTRQEKENMQKNIGDMEQIEGVKITILKKGSGDEAKSGNMVAMNYTGKLTDGTVFDSNVDPKFGHVQPFIFTIGESQVIKGWDVGVAGMKAGEKRILEIAPDYAYGAVGTGGVIPPNATIIFEVELLQIKK